MQLLTKSTLAFEYVGYAYKNLSFMENVGLDVHYTFDQFNAFLLKKIINLKLFN